MIAPNLGTFVAILSAYMISLNLLKLDDRMDWDPDVERAFEYNQGYANLNIVCREHCFQELLDGRTVFAYF